MVLNAIQQYVHDQHPKTAATVLAKYTKELDNTYVAYSGTTAMNHKNDYVRLDGPSVWTEFSSQAGIVVRNVPYPHSVGATAPPIMAGISLNSLQKN